ncbi:peptidase M48 [Thiococcus pfennigii]|jgi:predicted Zn-dependent protease|nr:peptidase M48 [Thiococcus pfennigii]
MKTLSRSLLLVGCLALISGGSNSFGEPLDLGLDTGRRQIALPDFGSSADSLLSTGEERRLGRAFMQSVRRSLPVIDDPFLDDYINGLGHGLVAAGDAKGRHFRFFLIEDSTVNAFAGPDGYVGVYAGLVLAAETESELAAVLAHEIAHVTQRHLMRAYEDTQKMSLPATALMIGAAILGAQVSGDAGAAAMAGIQAATLQRQINFTRENEQEADRIGIAMLADAGYNPYAMAGFFDRLAKATRIQESAAPEMLRTHPVTTNRISDALGRAEEYGVRQRPDSLRFQLARADLRQRSYRRPEQAIDHFRATLREGRYANALAERYGYTLALMRGDQLGAARKELGRLLEARPGQAELLALDGELARRSGNMDEALRTLREAFGLSPTSLPLRIAYAETLIDAGRPAEGLRLLEQAARRTDGSPSLYALMVRAALRAGDEAATYRYRAEEQYALGDIEAAIEQLERAVRQRDLSYYAASSIQARLDELEAERVAMKDDPWSKGASQDRD